MDDNLKDPTSQSFQYIKQTKSELDSLIIGRNELAKWYKRNSVNPSAADLKKFKVTLDVVRIRREQRFNDFGFNQRDLDC
jgi:hypothetical protein